MYIFFSFQREDMEDMNSECGQEIKRRIIDLVHEMARDGVIWNPWETTKINPVSFPYLRIVFSTYTNPCFRLQSNLSDKREKKARISTKQIFEIYNFCVYS